MRLRTNEELIKLIDEEVEKLSTVYEFSNLENKEKDRTMNVFLKIKNELLG